uniref:EGF-like domain-containing protein n=1 Tax=Heterorhabditis bacteriophora TaxID=37862 RepID=A0A1I7WEF8_HETBA
MAIIHPVFIVCIMNYRDVYMCGHLSYCNEVGVCMNTSAGLRCFCPEGWSGPECAFSVAIGVLVMFLMVVTAYIIYKFDYVEKLKILKKCYKIIKMLKLVGVFPCLLLSVTFGLAIGVILFALFKRTTTLSPILKSLALLCYVVVFVLVYPQWYFYCI